MGNRGERLLDASAAQEEASSILSNSGGFLVPVEAGGEVHGRGKGSLDGCGGGFLGTGLSNEQGGYGVEGGNA